MFPFAPSGRAGPMIIQARRPCRVPAAASLPSAKVVALSIWPPEKVARPTVSGSGGEQQNQTEPPYPNLKPARHEEPPASSLRVRVLREAIDGPGDSPNGPVPAAAVHNVFPPSLRATNFL